jgi:16S rRNA (guanine1516-N2)-methyltransferase
VDKNTAEDFFLSWRDGCLKLLDKELLKKGGLTVDIEPRNGEQRSWPAPKNGALAQAIGRKTKTVIDATTGWAQDSLHIFRMGYELRCIERSPIMLELLGDAYLRLEQLAMIKRNLPLYFYPH